MMSEPHLDDYMNFDADNSNASSDITAKAMILRDMTNKAINKFTQNLDKICIY